MSLNDLENKQAVELIKKAHFAEISGNFKKAYDLHVQAIRLLNAYIARGQKKSEERRRAKLNLRASILRQDNLRPCVEGNGAPPPGPLPSVITLATELRSPLPGSVLISSVEMGRSSTLIATPGMSEQRPPQSSNEFLTNLLSPSLPDVTYHIYDERVQRFNKGTWYYFHVKDDTKTTTLYTLSALKAPRFQIPLVTMSRAAEYHTNCASIAVTPIAPPGSSSEGGSIGRPLKVQNGTQKVIPDAPDRAGRDWTPRRFTYGGRRFVWKEGDEVGSLENLYEVVKEWPDPKSKTGKVLDQTHSRPLVWGSTKIARDKVCTIHMVGGLDQMFREFLLAGQLTRQLIGLHGH